METWNPGMNMPKKISVRIYPEGPVYVYSWRRWEFFFSLLIGLAISVGCILLPSLIGDPPPLIIWLILILISAMGLGLAYWSLARLINRTEIRLSQGVLFIRHKPLPWRGNRSIPADQVSEINLQTRYTRTEQGSFPNEYLVAWLLDGKVVDLVSRIELPAGLYLAHELEVQLGLRQALTSEEQEAVSAQYRWEEHGVDLEQMRVAIPILMFATPFLLLGSLYVLGSNFFSQQEARSSQDWPMVEGQISSTSVKTETYKKKDFDTDAWISELLYIPVINYRYTVNGRTYINSRLDFSDGGAYSTVALANKVIASYPIGSKVVVYYNSKSPEHSVLDRTFPSLSVYFMVGGILLAIALIGIIMIVWAVRKICLGKGQPDAWKQWSFWLELVPFLRRSRTVFGVKFDDK